MEDFVPYELAVKLRDKGFNCNCLFAFNDEQIINPNVVEKYGALSDDGYYELTKNGGGELDWDYVYIYETKLMLKRNIILKRNFIDAPTISQVLKWLREEKKIFIRVTLSYDYSTDADGEQVDRWTFWLFEVFSVGSGSLIYTEEISEYDSYEQAALAGIEYVINNLI